ncbi:TonB-dependent receptor [Pseudoteredinibacter isoporae]|uniref:Hemoglobin/transferrin/lactoferrin receptor protein n=1 Tax=Pseudoteredinibacter isoporae TaxID=570281 RepID=A0A7X0JV01_9GAMM|nr:TonB-dependent receptor [Pseudoteredinibacter isoporae]MBB6522652.1 hemoglobin/transferrin/lactoferrin receptor protein [Pseudoteredinibacter isoporae]NHO88182.1 TonB-dependent receptor [Pseudoteredinibacter isoporae]NIB23487.1 TonB-dependent receptor [Pseudoteredinibacter isoporae]
MRTRPLLLSLLSAAIAPSHAFANNAIEEIVVTAVRQQAALEDLPYASYHVSEDSLKQARSLPESLAGIPGVSVQKTANGQGSPFIRGFTGYRTLALIDGVRYNNSVYRDGPSEYFGLIDSQGLSGLELINGPASVLYGSDAIGGTLNLHSKSPTAFENNGFSKQFRQQLRWSSAENSLRSRSELDIGRGNDWGLLAGFSYKDFGSVKAADLGTLATSGYSERSYDIHYKKQLNEDWQLQALYQNLQQDDVWRTHSTIYAKPFAGSSVGSDLRRSKDQQRRFGYLKLIGQNKTPWIDRTEITLSRQEWIEFGQRQRSSSDWVVERFDSRMSGLDIQLHSQLGDHQFTYGLDIYRDLVDTGRRELDSQGQLIRERIQGPVGDDSRFSQGGIYTQWQYTIHDDWQWQIGSRYTWVRASIARFEDPSNGQVASYAQQWNNVSSSLKLLWQPQDSNWQAWFGISQAFRAPNIADLSRFGASRSNETEIAALALSPEHFLTGEASLRWSNLDADSGALWQLNAFHTDIEDYISSTPTGRIVEGLIEVSKANSSNGYMHGFEAIAQWRLNHHWQLKANASWVQGEQSLPDFRDDQYFSRSMPFSGSAALAWNHLGHKVEIELRHNSKANHLSPADLDDTQRIPPGGTPAFTLLNIRSEHPLSSVGNWYLDLNNVTDEAYRSHGSGINEPGRGISVGVDIRW